MALRLYADECVDARIVSGLRRRGIDVLAAADEGLLGTSDDRQMDQATRLGRAVVTSDSDFLSMAHLRAEQGIRHPGVLFILPGVQVGAATNSWWALPAARHGIPKQGSFSDNV